MNSGSAIGGTDRRAQIGILNPTRIVMDATMQAVVEVGDHFLYRCDSLTEVGLTPLVCLRNFGALFLSACPLKKQDLTPSEGWCFAL